MKVVLFIKRHNSCCRASCLYKASTFESSSETKMAKTRNLTQETRLKIQILSQEGYSCRQIARKCRCSPSAVGYTLQKYRRTNSLEDKPRSGRPRVSSARNDRILIRMCRENRRMTSQELQQQWSNQTGVQCSTRAVRGRLLDHGLRSYKAVKKPLINERQRLARRRWAQAHKNWTARNWKKILWSDESSFQLYLPPANVRVRRRPGEALSPACTVPTVKHGGGSIMVWGCMSAAGVHHLTVCDGTLNSAKYCAILETHMLPSACALFRRGQNWMFQQDNAPCHTSRSSRTWLQEHSIQVLEWPAQSPDMSPIENLWWIIKRSVSKRTPKNLEELKAAIQEEWDKITPQQCERLVGNMPARIRALLRANGRTTKY